MHKNYIWDKRTDSELFLMPKLCEENYLNTPNMPTSAKIIAPQQTLYDILGERGIITASIAMHQKGFYLELLKSKHLQITFTLSGCAKIKSDGKKFLAEKDSYFITPENSNFIYDAHKSWNVFWFHLKPNSFWKELFPKEPQVRKTIDGESIISAMRLYLHLIRQSSISLPALEKNADLIVELLRRELASEAKNTRTFIDRILQNSGKNSPQNHSLIDVAKSNKISVATLNRISTKNYGMTFGKLLVSQKMKRAKELLLETSFTNLKIAQIVGYSSEAAFSKAFKKHYGFPPSKLRE